MATATTKAQCSVCKKETSTFNCQGCSQNFCWNDLNKHRQAIGEQFDEIEVEHDQLRQNLLDQRNNPDTFLSIQEINKWEEESIQIIRQRANECRKKLINYLNQSSSRLETQLNNLGQNIKNIREHNEYNEVDINCLKKKLTKLDKHLNKSSDIFITQISTSLVNDLALGTHTKWKQIGITIMGGNGQGNQMNQLHYPRGIYIDDDQTLYVADCNNHRIIEWKSSSANRRIAAGGNGQGNQMNQLNSPRDVLIDKECNSLIISDPDNRRIMRWSLENNTTHGEIIISNVDCRGLAMDKDGSLHVVDWKNNAVKRWKRGETNGIIVAGGNGEGAKLNQLNFPSYIFVDEDFSLYVSDENNHRVMKWMKDANEGIIVAGGNGKGNNLKQLSQPQGVVVDKLGHIYVADWNNHRVMCWREGEKEGSIVVGGKGQGNGPNQFYNPQGLSFAQQRSLYVSDHNNNRIQKFEIDYD